MKFYLFLITFFAFGYTFSFEDTTSCLTQIDSVSNEEVYYIVDQLPEFPGGIDSMHRYIASNFKYPGHGCFTSNVSTYIGFIVDKHGDIEHIRILKGFDNEINKSIVELIESFPKWKPAKCQDEKVPFLMILPIKIGFR